MPQKTLEEIISNRIEIDYVKSKIKNIPLVASRSRLIRHTVSGQKTLDDIFRDGLKQDNILTINENTKLINKMSINKTEPYIEHGEPTYDICNFPYLNPTDSESTSIKLGIEDHTKICKYKRCSVFYILIIILLITINNIILLNFTNLEWN